MRSRIGRHNPLRKAGALLASGGLRRIKERMNPETLRGAPVLGLRGSVVKIHGSAKRLALKNAILQSARAVNQAIE